MSPSAERQQQHTWMLVHDRWCTCQGRHLASRSDDAMLHALHSRLERLCCLPLRCARQKRCVGSETQTVSGENQGTPVVHAVGTAPLDRHHKAHGRSRSARELIQHARIMRLLLPQALPPSHDGRPPPSCCKNKKHEGTLQLGQRHREGPAWYELAERIADRQPYDRSLDHLQSSNGPATEIHI